MLALDHIVFACNDAEEASKKYGSKYSIKAIKGGEHENWGTNNYLAHFSNNSYIEWLGIHNLGIAEKSDNPLIEHLVHHLKNEKTGPYQIALRTNEMDKLVEHFKKNNIPYKGPYEGKRQKPDGVLLKWRMLFPVYDYTKEMLPFLIQWDNANHSIGSNANSLANPQAITEIHYSGTDKEKFAHIYQLKSRKMLKNQLLLQNTKILFKKEKDLNFTLA